MPSASRRLTDKTLSLFLTLSHHTHTHRPSSILSPLHKPCTPSECNDRALLAHRATRQQRRRAAEEAKRTPQELPDARVCVRMCVCACVRTRVRIGWSGGEKIVDSAAPCHRILFLSPERTQLPFFSILLHLLGPVIRPLHHLLLRWMHARRGWRRPPVRFFLDLQRTRRCATAAISLLSERSVRLRKGDGATGLR